MKIICISDTHGAHRSVSIPDGDLLLHAGDLTNRGELEQVADFNDWLGGLPHAHKVVIAGNHDFCFENKHRVKAEALLTNATYLFDRSVEIEGLTLYGSPWQPWFGGWAFNRKRGADIAEVWEQIPDETDILITHGPPAGILDLCVHGEGAGCKELLYAVEALRPRLHVFGHIHEAYGEVQAGQQPGQSGTTFVNASIMTFQYEPTNAPIMFEV